MAKKVRNFIENPTEKTYGLNTKETIENLIDGLGITEEEYWDEFVINSYKQQIIINELRNIVLKNVDSQDNEKVWINFKEKAINDFKSKNSVEIQKFKNMTELNN